MQFLGEDITLSDAKKFIASISSYDLQNTIADDEDEEMTKETVINF